MIFSLTLNQVDIRYKVTALSTPQVACWVKGQPLARQVLPKRQVALCRLKGVTTLTYNAQLHRVMRWQIPTAAFVQPLLPLSYVARRHD